ncbi:MAG: nucleotidyltransferase family protein [Candidatus Omnitrophica bacterium]|nr:nucleotidyltransferase family protein [Candidatus Omnitrophota bacterium]
MTRENVIKMIRNHRAVLDTYSVKRLALFGSCARGEERPQSDLDFLVEFHQKSFDAYMGLKLFLEDLFQCRVDLVLADTLKPRLRQHILKEMLDAA